MFRVIYLEDGKVSLYEKRALDQIVHSLIGKTEYQLEVYTNAKEFIASCDGFPASSVIVCDDRVPAEPYGNPAAGVGTAAGISVVDDFNSQGRTPPYLAILTAATKGQVRQYAMANGLTQSAANALPIWTKTATSTMDKVTVIDSTDTRGSSDALIELPTLNSIAGLSTIVDDASLLFSAYMLSLNAGLWLEEWIFQDLPDANIDAADSHVGFVAAILVFSSLIGSASCSDCDVQSRFEHLICREDLAAVLIGMDRRASEGDPISVVLAPIVELGISKRLAGFLICHISDIAAHIEIAEAHQVSNSLASLARHLRRVEPPRISLGVRVTLTGTNPSGEHASQITVAPATRLITVAK